MGFFGPRSFSSTKVQAIHLPPAAQSVEASTNSEHDSVLNRDGTTRSKQLRLNGNTPSSKESQHRLSSSSPTKFKSKSEQSSFWSTVHVLHRLLILSAAVVYVIMAIIGSIRAIEVLMGETTKPIVSIPYETLLMGPLVGTTTIRQSPLVTNVLENDTSPRNFTLYIDQDGTYVSHTQCATATDIDAIYENKYLRLVYAALVRDTSYHITQFQDAELIAPVVDCTSSALVFGDATAARFFFLIRNGEDVMLVILMASNQGYRVVGRDELGSAQVSSLALIRDVTSTPVEHLFVLSLGYPFQPLQYQVYELLGVDDESFLRLRSFPRDTNREVSRTLETSCRAGTYFKTETEQSNISNLYWVLPSDATDFILRTQWKGTQVLRNSWAWVHCIHLFLASTVLFNLIVLVMVTGRNFQAGKYWIGDSFVTISTSLVGRGVLVLLTWWISKFWTLVEFCLNDAHAISPAPDFFIYEEIIRADLITIYLSLVGLLGKVLRERIDPALAVYLFWIGFAYRLTIVQWFPALTTVLLDHSMADFGAGAVVTAEDTSLISPMRLWGIHALLNKDIQLIAATLFPVFSTLIVILTYALTRKLYRRLKRQSPIVTSTPSQRKTGNVSYPSTSEDHDDTNAALASLLADGVIRTQFEAATGAQLENQFGLVSDYENFRLIKGLTYASADGIYSNGFVIANGKFLVQTQDLGSIVLMKLVRVRYRNVYVYDVHGFKVDAFARLVYPETLSWSDLLHLNISVLA